MTPRPLAILRLLFSSKLEHGDTLVLNVEEPDGRISYALTSPSGEEKARGIRPAVDQFDEDELRTPIPDFLTALLMGRIGDVMAADRPPAPSDRPPAPAIPSSARKMLASLRLHGSIGPLVPPEWMDDLSLLLELGLVVRDEKNHYVADLDFEPSLPPVAGPGPGPG